ncbi:hypothetical protein CVT25_003648 [Psilocybe cyanescens]|uniref:Uncharacterized protein n=1 Tax=Psilocybe cyanescens TaxID=93625 RepID=A0A409WPC4_PSICY|nr:hypothetical protein CVT25_003648 [Psilocybe cyanescens]
MYLNEAHVLHDVLWDIARQMVVQIVNFPERPSHDYLVHELDSFNLDLSAHLDRSKRGALHYGNNQQELADQKRIREYISAIRVHEHMGDMFLYTFRSLQEDHFRDMPLASPPVRRHI